VIVMGVSGAGKTTVGSALAGRLGWAFIEGDDFHPASNVAKMASGHPLTDADRASWLAALRRKIEEVIESASHAVIACSALKHAYRSVLAGDDPDAVRFVQLDVPVEVLRERLEHRHGHFMPASLIGSQLATLEPSRTALRVDGTQPVAQIVDDIERWLSG
jgi:carbohydrate kinase (thermoresistant glucokinase family)